MLHALLKHKLKETYRNRCFEPSEDSKTSSVFGLLQYLPAQFMWNLLRQSCGNNSSLIENSGELLNIQFWTRWLAEGDESANSKYVEPDVFCEFDNFNLIVEAKKNDNFGQYEQQLKKEIDAYLKEYPNCNKKMIFIAFGGNKSIESKRLSVSEQEFIVFSASWLNLLNAINNSKKASFGREKRLLSDIILAFEKHNFFCLEWLESLTVEKHISQQSLKTIDFWKFRTNDFLNNFFENDNIKIHNYSKNIFALWKTH